MHKLTNTSLVRGKLEKYPARRKIIIYCPSIQEFRFPEIMIKKKNILVAWFLYGILFGYG